jgi:hypothetical protein
MFQALKENFTLMSYCLLKAAPPKLKRATLQSDEASTYTGKISTVLFHWKDGKNTEKIVKMFLKTA